MKITDFQALRRREFRVVLALSAVSTALLTGCGSSGSTDAARIRSVDAATDAATSNVLVNGSSANGDQTYFTTSSYLYISTGVSTFSYTTTAATPTAAVFQSTTHTLNNGQFYTAYLVGRPDVPTTDIRFLQVIVTDDSKPSLTSGQAAVRVLDAAPDAGAVDVRINGSVINSAFGNITYTVPGNAFSPSTYSPVTAGTLSVQVNAAGTSTVIVPATNVPVTAGNGYTLLVTEPTGGTTPTFSLKTTTE